MAERQLQGPLYSLVLLKGNDHVAIKIGLKI